MNGQLNDSIRIASLLPGATEIVAALGALDQLVGISHECDHPAAALDRPRLTWSPIDRDATGAEIDRFVRELSTKGEPVIAVDGATLARVRPTVVLTQDLCHVCAVVDGDIRSLAETLDPAPTVLPLSGRTVAGVLDDIRAIGQAIGRSREAAELVTRIAGELGAGAESTVRPRPRVVVIEWLEPVFIAGHWVPDLVWAAGGRDVGAEAGAHSVTSTWSAVAAKRPDLIVIALCGMSLERAAAEWRRVRSDAPGSLAPVLGLRIPIWAIDGNAFTSRPGPRMPEAAALLRQAIGSALGETFDGLERLPTA